MINKNRKRKQKKWQSLAPVMSFCGMRVILICCLLIFASSIILFVLLFVLRKDAKEHEVSAEFLVGSLAVTGRWGLISPPRTDNSGWMTKPKRYIFPSVFTSASLYSSVSLSPQQGAWPPEFRRWQKLRAAGRGSSCRDVTAVRALGFVGSCSVPVGSGLWKCAPGELCFSEGLYQPEACWTHSLTAG